MKSKIAIFASGQGSNARRLVEYFSNSSRIEVDSILCNRKEAGVYEVAKDLGLEIQYFSRAQFDMEKEVVDYLQEKRIDWIVLAGFLLKVPHLIIKKFPQKIINIHPALLPKFGGKGMYGNHVHQAVIEAGEKESGISIHFVDQDYDTGSMIAQFKCEIEENETVESLRSKIRLLEHEHFPQEIERLILNSDC